MNPTEYQIQSIKCVIDNYCEKETVFWDGEYFYSREHCHDITFDQANEWARDILAGLR